jgi:plasmid stabilization system protein ParE
VARTLQATRRTEQEISLIYARSVDEFGFVAASRFVEGLRKRIRSLTYSDTGTEWRCGTRRLLYKPYWIYYVVQCDHVLVLTIRHAKRRPPPTSHLLEKS